MAKDDPAPPVAPDPAVTAAAAAKYNTNTAITQQLLNQTDQVGPDGSLKYDQTGTQSFVGADGQTYTVPKFTATTTLSPAQQALYDLQARTRTNVGQIGLDASTRIGHILGTDFKIDPAVEDKLTALAASRVDPMYARNEEALRTRLKNSGINPGSEAWNSEFDQFNKAKNDAYSSLYLAGRGQAMNEALTERSLPINEVSALMSGSQVSQPNFMSTPTTGVAGVDYGGLVNNNYNAQMSAYNAKVGANGAAMGGMFGAAGTLGAAAMKYGPALLAASDRRLKSDVVRVGTTEGGVPIYDYTIFGERHRGVMADELEELMPEAVITHPSGFKMVDYSRLGPLADAGRVR